MPFKFNARQLLIPAIAGGALLVGLGVAPLVPAPLGQAKEIVVAPPGGAPVSFADLIDRVSPAVVSIMVRTPPDPDAALRRRGIDPERLPPEMEEYFRRNLPPADQIPESVSLGSGFFVDDAGTVVTNNHVIDKAIEIKVKTSAGKEYNAELVGTDPLTDLAVLKLNTKERGFSYVTFDRDADLRVGDWVIAVGNPFGLQGTATAGIVSALGRRDLGAGSSYVDFIQTDASINQGNSGGPTFDLKGRVVGVNTIILSPSDNGGSVGIGFAIRSQDAADVVDKLLSKGKVARGWLGVTVHPVDAELAAGLGLPDAKGAMVAAVVPDGPAARGGIQQGDVILKVGGQAVEDSRDLTRKVGAFAIGKSAQLEVLRDGKRRTVEIKLSERPNEQALSALARNAPAREPAAPPAPAVGAVKPAGFGFDARPVSAADRQRLNMQWEYGLSITRIDVNSALARKGVRVGDVIVTANGRPLRASEDFNAAVLEARQAKRPLVLLVATPGGPRYVGADIEN